MSNIDKQAYRADGGDIGTDRLREIADNPYGDEEKCWLAKRVISLQAELEVKDKAWSAHDNHINQQADRIELLEKKNGELGRALGAAEKRIAELEALARGVKQYSEFQICHYGATEDYAKGYIDCQNNYNKVLFAAAGKGEAS